jgi:hypothetical protein
MARGRITIGESPLVVRKQNIDRFPRYANSTEWAVSTYSGANTSHHRTDSTLASFVGISVIMRAGFDKKKLVRWVELIGTP